MTCQQWRCHQYEDEGGKENPDGRNDGAPETSNQITNESGGDNDRAWTDHANCDSNQELALVKPVVVLHQSLLEEWDNHETAAECERSRF